MSYIFQLWNSESRKLTTVNTVPENNAESNEVLSYMQIRISRVGHVYQVKARQLFVHHS
jgi:hypothetical protein